jgi:hypothetical protein
VLSRSKIVTLDTAEAEARLLTTHRRRSLTADENRTAICAPRAEASSTAASLRPAVAIATCAARSTIDGQRRPSEELRRRGPPFSPETSESRMRIGATFPRTASRREAVATREAAASGRVASASATGPRRRESDASSAEEALVAAAVTSPLPETSGRETAEVRERRDCVVTGNGNRRPEARAGGRRGQRNRRLAGSGDLEQQEEEEEKVRVKPHGADSSIFH